MRTHYNYKNSIKQIKQNRKGQVVVYDFISGFVIFMVIITVTSVFWFKVLGQINQDEQQYEKLQTARHISHILAKTEGYPYNWELNSAGNCLVNNCSIGLADDINIISSEKLDALIALIENESLGEDYGYNKTRMLLNIEKHDYYLILRDVDGAPNRSAGKEALQNISATIRRTIMIDDQLMALDFTVY